MDPFGLLEEANRLSYLSESNFLATSDAFGIIARAGMLSLVLLRVDDLFLIFSS